MRKEGRGRGRGGWEGKTLFPSPREGEGLIFFRRGRKKGRGKLDFLPQGKGRGKNGRGEGGKA